MSNNEKENPEGAENEEILKRDKIFDNEYESTEYEATSTKFTIDESYREKGIDEKIDEEFVKRSVKATLSIHPKFHKFSTKDENGDYPKINKSEINEIYSHVINDLPDLPKIEIFSALVDYYDVTSEKFYESLSNSFKTQLIIELRNRGYLKKRNFLF
jgi:hypothetical protein